MTDKNDEYYQPWLRGPDAAARQGVPESQVKADEGLAKPSEHKPREHKPREQAPIGIDVSHYPADDDAFKPRTPRAQSSDRLKSGANSLWNHLRTGSSAFADWTIRIGDRADVPGRLAALEIPRRSGVAVRHGAALSKQIATAAGRSAARGGRSAAAASGSMWQKLALGEKITKVAGGTGRGLGAVADRTRSKIATAAKAGKNSLGEAASKLNPAPPAAPSSGLDQLLEREQAKTDTKSAPDLPLFASEKMTAAPTATKAVPTQKPAPAPSPAKRTIAAQAPAQPAVTAALSSFPAMSATRWAAVLFVALVLIAGSFWLGGRFGGGMNRGQVEAVVASYIQEHPEIIPQALEAHQANQVAKEIEAIRPALERPYAGAWAGNINGDVNVVVFTDYACVFCRASVPDIDRLLREDKRVKVIFRELPIIAPQSRDAALMALAAARQGKYDAFHHAMFASPALDSAAIKRVADKVGVVTDGSADATGSQALLQRELDSNIAIAQQLQLNATPTWIIGDQLMQGQLGYAGLRDAVAKARKAKS